MLTKGLMKTCDRCGESVFLKQIEPPVETGRHYDYEEGPSGWTVTDVLKTCHHDICRDERVTLCPVCAMMLVKIHDAFMDYYPEEKT